MSENWTVRELEHDSSNPDIPYKVKIFLSRLYMINEEFKAVADLWGGGGGVGGSEPPQEYNQIKFKVLL